MLVSKDCLNFTLAKQVQSTDNFIWLSGADAYKLNTIGVDNYIHLTLSDNRTCETVRYDHTTDWPNTSSVKQVSVVRDVSGTGRKNFAVHSCVTADWSVAQITELVEQTVCTAPCIVSLSTITSSAVYGLSTAHSAIASLSSISGKSNSAIASLSTLTKTDFASSGSAIASLSTVVTGLATSGSLEATNSAVASLSTLATGFAASSGLTTTNSAVASLSTIVSGSASNNGLVAANSAIASLSTITSTVTSAVFSAPAHGNGAPAFQPSQSSSKYYVDDTLGEVWEWNGESWVLIKGFVLDTLGATGTISLGSDLLLYSYTVPRNCTAGMSGQVFLVVNQDIVTPYYAQVNLILYRNGNAMAMQSVHMDEAYGITDGARASVSYAVGGFVAGDVISLAVGVSALQPGLSLHVDASSFQLVLKG